MEIFFNNAYFSYRDTLNAAIIPMITLKHLVIVYGSEKVCSQSNKTKYIIQLNPRANFLV